MKVAILSIPPRTNYGGLLQLYALQTFLESLGHSVVILDKPYERKLSIKRRYLAYLKRGIIKYFLRKNIEIFVERKYNKFYPIISQLTNQFIKDYLRIKSYDSLYDIQEKEYDAFVVGSDQIWRKKYNKIIQNSFLDFAVNWKIKRIAYAASFGTKEWEYSTKETEMCKDLLKLFDAVSVREATAINLCNKHLCYNNVSQVLDPTLLIPKAKYEELIINGNTNSCEGDLFVYFLDDSILKRKFVASIAHKMGLKQFFIELADINNKKIIPQPSVQQWLRSFRDSKFVITDSFHGTIFSIIFNKPFIAIGNAKRGLSRFLSLLSLYGLEDRLVLDINNPKIKIPEIKEMDYTLRGELLQNSRNFLKQSFKL